ncbi:MAG TPA: PaaI family thioesterase [Terracidiphilus sp.]|nr:PaaI family thioesterase [Terracidiphilus sp.]
MKPHFDNLTPLAHSAQNCCFGCGEANQNGLQLEFLLAQDGTVVCPATIPNRFEGHPGFLHGGIIATLLDETMSKTVRARGLTAMTRHLEVDYRRPVSSCTPIRMEGRIVRDEGRKHWVEATIFDGDGHSLAHGKGLFVEVRVQNEKEPRRTGADSNGA